MNRLVAKRLHTLRGNLYKHFKIAEGNKESTTQSLSAAVSDPIMVGHYIRVVRNLFPGRGTTLRREVSATFSNDWTAERWGEFEQECKENL